MSAEGGQPRSLTGACYGRSEVVWSPDSQYFAYSVKVDETSGIAIADWVGNCRVLDFDYREEKLEVWGPIGWLP